MTDKATRRENQRRADRYRPKGSPKFLILMVQQQERRREEKIARLKEVLEGIIKEGNL